MKKPFLPKFLGLAVATLLPVGLQSARADVITAPDFSFEAPVTASFQDNSGILTDAVIPGTSNAWYYLGGFAATGSPVGVQNNAANGFTAGSNPDGTQVGYVNRGAFMGSTFLTTIAANTTYTLTVAEGNRGGGFAQSSGFTLALAFGSLDSAPTSALTNSSNWASFTHVDYAGSPAVGTYGDYTVTFTTGTSDSFIGQSLYVVLGSDNPGSGNNPISYDNVRLTASAVPEPTTLAMVFGGFGMLTLLRRRRATN